MLHTRNIFLLSLPAMVSLLGQTTYSIHNVAGGTFPDGAIATQVSLGQVTGIAVDPSGNVYISSGRVYQVTKDGKIKILPAAFRNSLLLANGIAADRNGNLFVVFPFYEEIDKIDATGRSTNYFGGGGLAGNSVGSLTVDATGNLYFADSSIQAVLKLDPTLRSTYLGYSGSLVPPSNISGGIAVDSAGSLYVSDLQNNLIRKRDPQGNVSVFAGTGQTGSGGDGGLAIGAQIEAPRNLGIDLAGNLYVSTKHGIRKIDTNGMISSLYKADYPLAPPIAVDLAGEHVYFVNTFGNLEIRSRASIMTVS